MAEMHNPAHPGEIVRKECLKPLGLTLTAAADALGVTRKALSDLLNGHAGVSPDMAIRLEKVFGTRRIPGSGCRCSMTFGKPGNGATRSKSTGALATPCQANRLRKNSPVIPGRPFRAGPGIQEHTPNH